MGGKPRRFTDEEEAEIAQEYLGGLGAPLLAKKWGSSHKTIYKALERQGIPTREYKISNGFVTGGYRWVRIYPDDEICWPMTYPRGENHYPFVMEHRVIMARHLGRPLRGQENVHHKHGDKLDNSIEDLELWTVSQPAGQRVQDKIEWAIGLLVDYGYEVSK